jgi:hypothetical protein
MYMISLFQRHGVAQDEKLNVHAGLAENAKRNEIKD